MGDEAAIIYRRERSAHNKGSIYLPHKQDAEDILYIHIDDPPLDLSRRNRRGDNETREDSVVVAVESPMTLAAVGYPDCYPGLSQRGSATAIGRRATTTTTTTTTTSASSAKLYKCCECDYVSKRSYDVRRHMKTHGNARPYGCPQCAHTARDAGSLRVHMLQRHGNLDQYVCPRCDYSSNRQAELARHIRAVHEPR